MSSIHIRNVITLLSIFACASEVHIAELGECEDVEASSTSLLQVSLNPHLSRDPVTPNVSLLMLSTCRKEYTFPLIFVGILVISSIFVGLGICARTCVPQVPAGEAHLADTMQTGSKGSAPPVRMAAVDGLRGVFVMSVIVGHTMLASKVMPGHLWAFHHFDAVSAMQYFFVVSGYVNVKSAETEREHFDLKAGCLFIQKRMARLLPMYWFSMLAVAITFLFRTDGSPLCPAGGWFRESLVVQSFYYGNAGAVGNSPDWFVSALMALTVCFPVLYNLLPSRSSTTFFLIVLMLIVRSCHYFIPAIPHYVMYLNNPIPRLPEFILGMLSAIWFRQMPPEAKAWPGWGCVFDAMVVLVYVIFEARANNTMPASGDLGITGLFCIMVIAANAAAESSLNGEKTASRFWWPKLGFTGMLFSSLPVQLVARYSWNFYLLQVAVLELCMVTVPMDWNNFMAYIPLLMIAGVLADVAVDQPVHRALSRYIRYQRGS